MWTFILVVVFYAIMFVVSKELTKSEHYGGALTLSVWMLIDYLFFDNLTMVFMLTVLSGAIIFLLSYLKAKWLDNNRTVLSYAKEDLKIEKRHQKEENILFYAAFIIAPFIWKYAENTHYIIWVPVVFFVIERCLFWMRRN